VLTGALLAAGCSTEQPDAEPLTASTDRQTGGATASLEAPFEAGPASLSDEGAVGPPYFPDAEAFPPAPAEERSPSDLLREVQALVGARDQRLPGEAAAVFSDEEVERHIPDPELRAAAVALLGTIAQPAIDWLVRDGPFEEIAFGDPPGAVIARSVAQPGGGQRIVVDRRFRFERPAFLSVVLAHEALHADGRPSDLEELIATALQALVHLEQLAADPTLADERTALAQATNAWVVIRLNTHEPGSSDLRLVLDDAGSTVLPDGLDRPHFASFFDPTASPSPGNPYLGALVAAVAEPGVTPPGRPDFDFETVAFLDANQGVLPIAEIVKAARALGLQIQPVA
jgi:hypothetical protein